MAANQPANVTRQEIKASLAKDGKAAYCSVVTPVGRVSYPKLDKPDTTGKYADNKYKLTLLFPADTDFTDLKAACLAAAKEMWPKLDPKKVKLPIRNGTAFAKARQPDDPESHVYYGTFFCTPKTKNKPGLVDKYKKPLVGEDAVYGGSFARCRVTCVTYKKTENVRQANGEVMPEDVFGVSLLLDSVQLVRDGERFGRSTADDFDGLPMDDEATSPGFVDPAHDDLV